MSDPTNSILVSRREVTRMLGGALALGAVGAGPALAQAGSVLPTIGQVRVANLELVVNGTRFSPFQKRKPTLPGLAVVVQPASGACRLEVASMTIVAEMTLLALPGPSKPYCGALGLEQFTQYTYQRSPSGLTGAGGNYACARSSGWELDGGGQAQTYNGLLPCKPGPNIAKRKTFYKKLIDGPGVETEDANVAYETVWAGPVGTITAPNMFRTWVVWDTTDDSRPPTKTNLPTRHLLARVDWVWQGQAHNTNTGLQSSCPSAVPHQNAGWDATGNMGSVTAVLFGAAVGAPPKKFMRAHNKAWVAGPC